MEPFTTGMILLICLQFKRKASDTRSGAITRTFTGTNARSNPSPEPSPNPGAGTSGGNQENEGEKKPVLRPVKNVKQKKGEAGKKSQSENIAEAIKRNAEKGETSLTVRNVPEVLEAKVFETLAEYPQFFLVLDCESYTLSIKGMDVKDPSASLHTRLVEMESELSDKEAENVPGISAACIGTGRRISWSCDSGISAP